MVGEAGVPWMRQRLGTNVRSTGMESHVSPRQAMYMMASVDSPAPLCDSHTTCQVPVPWLAMSG